MVNTSTALVVTVQSSLIFIPACGEDTVNYRNPGPSEMNDKTPIDFNGQGPSFLFVSKLRMLSTNLKFLKGFIKRVILVHSSDVQN